MQDATSVTVDIGGKTLTLETGVLARQAAGSCTVRQADTVLFSAVTIARDVRQGIDFFPLSVEYREKFYAAGRFPGGFFKRETRPSEKEILTARFTDRPIRPLFPQTLRNEVQINNMLMSADRQTDSDVLSITAASTSLTLSEIPFDGPIAGVRVGRVEGQWVINPTHAEREKSDLDLVYAGNRELPIMIEGGGNEVSEADLLAAMRVAHAACVKLIDAQTELRRKMGLPNKTYAEPATETALLVAARELAGSRLSDALTVAGKLEREGRVIEVKTSLKAALLARSPEMTDEQFRSTFDALEIETVRRNVLDRSRRIDGRGSDDLRPLAAKIGLFPRTHGSAVFNRGETQAVGIVTLGTKSDTQSLDAVTGGVDEKKFMLHYNFPPYATGETGRLGSTGRREIGHGALAERSLEPVIPVDFPYTVRMVSDIMGSNGSSSMASICVGTLALMDAGVPIKAPVAGISIGLFSERDRGELVVDILGSEDHCGDMDFKVAGTREGITGFQVDLKIHGLKWELVEGAFAKARTARLQILDFIQGVISEPRANMSEYAPRIQTLKIDPEKIGALIGPGGKTIRRITDLSGAQIDIDDDGTVHIFAVDEEAMAIALREVHGVTAEAEEGKIYDGTVTGVKEFGAFVEILPGRDGLVHISELADRRIERVEDVCKIGDQMWVKCIGVDDRGRVKLSRRQAMREMDQQA
jgi:polyribonucleotide nucleotidyltransferase